ncbi:hypothetical protein PGT21_009301 [Puccinia graminis f. sp. tritici]|nr:hypothetical protein PGT21_009301 [Puccinia graminis f. sp. tritici]
MAKCECSNCYPVEAATLIEALSVANNENFDDILNNNFTLTSTYNIKHKYPQKAPGIKKRKFTEDDVPEMDQFATMLMNDFNHHYETNVRPGGSTQGSDIFDMDDCLAILAQLEYITDPVYLKWIIGGECFAGQSSWLFNWITNYKLEPISPQISSKKGPLAKKAKQITSCAQSTSAPMDRSVLQVVTPRQPNKKELAAIESRRKALERQEAKRREEEKTQRRKEQIQQIMASSRAAQLIGPETHHTDNPHSQSSNGNQAYFISKTV